MVTNRSQKAKSWHCWFATMFHRILPRAMIAGCTSLGWMSAIRQWPFNAADFPRDASYEVAGSRLG
jgi:hypothetical protein